MNSLENYESMRTAVRALGAEGFVSAVLRAARASVTGVMSVTSVTSCARSGGGAPPAGMLQRPTRPASQWR